MDKIQKRALRVVLNDYQSLYKDLLKEVNRPTLYVSHMKTIAIEMFKCVKNIGPSFLRNIFTVQEQPYELRGGCKFIPPMVCTTTFGIYSFRYEGPKVWNNLPEYLKDANEVGEFKQLIQQWSGPKCQCENCILCNANNVSRYVYDYYVTMLHIICITMFKSYSHFHILTVPKHKKAQ